MRIGAWWVAPWALSTRKPGLPSGALARSFAGMSTLELIVEDLRKLPPPKLAEAAGFVHRLTEVTRAERLAALERSAGILTDAEGAELERVINEGCEKIDARDW
jgi:hypothetical protein